jgi:hypothetical protein
MTVYNADEREANGVGTTTPTSQEEEDLAKVLSSLNLAVEKVFLLDNYVDYRKPHFRFLTKLVRY